MAPSRRSARREQAATAAGRATVQRARCPPRAGTSSELRRPRSIPDEDSPRGRHGGLRSRAEGDKRTEIAKQRPRLALAVERLASVAKPPPVALAMTEEPASVAGPQGLEDAAVDQTEAG